MVRARGAALRVLQWHGDVTLAPGVWEGLAEAAQIKTSLACSLESRSTWLVIHPQFADADADPVSSLVRGPGPAEERRAWSLPCLPCTPHVCSRSAAYSSCLLGTWSCSGLLLKRAGWVPVHFRSWLCCLWAELGR